MKAARSIEISSSEIQVSSKPKKPPHTINLAKEARALFDIGSLPFGLIKSWLGKPELSIGEKYPIILLPGFASDERYMKPLEIYLRNLGFSAEGWGLGMNLAGADLPHTLEDLSDTWEVDLYDGYTPETYRGEGSVPHLCDHATDRIRTRAKELESPVILIGWSLGGYIAREVARELPEQVTHVITLGAPVIGGPKYTRAASVFRGRGQDLEWIETEIEKRDRTKIRQPITAIFSKSDGIVDWRAALDRVSPNVKHIEVKVPHLGMGFNQLIWKLITRSIRSHIRTQSENEH